MFYQRQKKKRRYFLYCIDSTTDNRTVNHCQFKLNPFSIQSSISILSSTWPFWSFRHGRNSTMSLYNGTMWWLCSSRDQHKKNRTHLRPSCAAMSSQECQRDTAGQTVSLTNEGEREGENNFWVNYPFKGGSEDTVGTAGGAARTEWHRVCL